MVQLTKSRHVPSRFPSSGCWRLGAMPRCSGMLWSLTLATSSSPVGGVWWKPRPLNGEETCPEENRGNARKYSRWWDRPWSPRPGGLCARQLEEHQLPASSQRWRFCGPAERGEHCGPGWRVHPRSCDHSAVTRCRLCVRTWAWADEDLGVRGARGLEEWYSWASAWGQDARTCGTTATEPARSPRPCAPRASCRGWAWGGREAGLPGPTREPCLCFCHRASGTRAGLSPGPPLASWVALETSLHLLCKWGRVTI